MYLADITKDPRFGLAREMIVEAGYNSVVSLPLVFRGEAIGVLNCYDRHRDYSEEQVKALVAYRADRVFDGVAEQAVRNGAVVVEGGRISYVGQAAGVPRGTEVVDLGDATLLPGLIDAHVHLVWSASAEPHEVVARDSRALTALRCANNGALQLGAGVTTVRDVGATYGLSIDVAQAVGLGVLAGPRVVAVGRAIAMIGGHGWFLGREADGPDAVRRAVREEMKAGATCIKLMASGGVYSHAEEPGSPQLTV